ncbi:MAG: AAA family ATPase [Candidatus Micrarchaeia archaeon]
MLILVTGSPCTGKTTSSKELGKILKMGVLHITDFVESNAGMLGGRFDKRMDSELVDVQKLGKALRGECRKHAGLIIEGHLACEVRLPADYVFVLRCRPDILETRLRKREYSVRKVEENLLSEMLDYCLQKAEANCPESNIIQIETAGSTAGKNAKRMAGIVRGAGRRERGEKVNYTSYLIRHLGLRNGRRQKKSH